MPDSAVKLSHHSRYHTYQLCCLVFFGTSGSGRVASRVLSRLASLFTDNWKNDLIKNSYRYAHFLPRLSVLTLRKYYVLCGVCVNKPW